MRKPLTPEQKAARKVYKRQWYLANRERTLAVNQTYRKQNPEFIDRLKKEWADANRERLNIRRTELRAMNPERRKAYDTEWREQNREAYRTYQREYYMQNQDKLKRQSREWFAENRPYALERGRKRGRARLEKQWLKRAGWTPEEYARRRKMGCEICGVEETNTPKGTLAFDHDHDTGLVRGLLCHKCNMRLDWAIKYYEEIGCYHRLSLEAAA